MPESSKLEFLQKFLANKFALPGAKGSTLGSLNRRGIAESRLLRILLTIRQMFGEPSF